MSVKLLTEHHLEFLGLKGGCTGSSESTLVKIPHYWYSHVMAHIHVLKHVHEILLPMVYAQKPPIKAHADLAELEVKSLF